jgi:hypothetical protein
VIGLETRKWHPIARNYFRGLCQIGIMCRRIPRQRRLFHGRRIAEIGIGRRFAADDPGKAWAQDGLSWLQRMTGLTFLEDLTPGVGVALQSCSGGNWLRLLRKRRGPGRRSWLGLRHDRCMILHRRRLGSFLDSFDCGGDRNGYRRRGSFPRIVSDRRCLGRNRLRSSRGSARLSFGCGRGGL